MNSRANPIDAPAEHPVRRRASLRSNIGALFALQAANYLIPLATVPYLIRVLGARAYGQLAFAYATTFFMVLFVDAGFNSRASRELAHPTLAAAKVNAIYAATQWLKCAVALCMLAVLSLLVRFVPEMQATPMLYFFSFLTVIGTLAFPTWVFQGLELMHHTTVCSVSGRLLATLGIFLFVKSPDDLVWAALLQASGTLLAGLMATPILYGRLGLSLRLPWGELCAEVRAAWYSSRSLLLSEYLANALSNAGVFVLGMTADSAATGVYAAVEKIARAAYGLFWPFMQGLLPRITRGWRQDPCTARVLAQGWTLRIAGAALGIAAVLGAFPGTLLELGFGAGWSAHAAVLRIFAAWLVLSVSAAAVGQLWLLAPGRLALYARHQLRASLVQLVAILGLAPALGAVGVALALVIAEFIRLGLVLHDGPGFNLRNS